MDEINDDSLQTSLLFHNSINFDTAVLHITAFEDLIALKAKKIANLMFLLMLIQIMFLIALSVLF